MADPRPVIVLPPALTTLPPSAVFSSTVVVPLSTWNKSATNNITPGDTEQSGETNGWAFGPGALQHATAVVQLPLGWSTGIELSLLAANNDGTATNDALLGVKMLGLDVGDSINGTPTDTSQVFTVGGVQWTLQEFTFTTKFTVPLEEFITFQVYRNGPDASDTYGADLFIMALKLKAITV